MSSQGLRMGRAAAPVSSLGCVLLAMVLGAGCAATEPEPAREDQKMFATPEEAGRALVEALRADDRAQLDAILGASGRELYDSGDPVSDGTKRKRFLDAYAEKNRIDQRSADEAVLCVGEVDWPLPIPIVKENGQWVFDTEGAKQEILDLRVGKNELSAIQVCLAFVDAQQEYAEVDRDGDGILEYAQKGWSSAGKKDGLYWETADGEPPSPLGPMAATAAAEGYTPGTTGGRAPYHGYLYKVLTAQGPHAQGGAYDYLVRGNMIGGFAMIAWPAEYGVSGIKTLVINHEGTVFQKDLGDDTEKLAGEMQVFDPDPTWKPAKS